MNKNILIIVAAIIVVAVAAIGAFVLLQTPLEAHDFGPFTMDVPEHSHFEEGNVTNGIQALAVAITNTSSSDPEDILAAYGALLTNPAYIHPTWGDESHNILIHYINCSEDNITDHSQIGSDLFIGARSDSSQGNMFFFTMDSNDTDDNSTYNITRVICVESGNGSMVIVAGSDDGLLRRMAETIHFK